jgi:hypothetical protein
VLVRPHPERLKEWAGVSLDGLDNVAFRGRNPIDAESKHDYFDAIYYSAAVVGLVTSAFLEAAIVGRPVLTLTLPEYRIHQEEMIHFQYLMTVEGGLLHMAPDIETHLRQLADAVSGGGERDERNRRFVSAFVRPGGLDVPATPAFADALEQLHREGARVQPPLETLTWLRPVLVRVASWSRTGPVRWLMNDMRADAWDERAEWTQQSLDARREAKAARMRAKARRKEQRRRHDALMRRGKEVKSALRSLRYRTAVAIYRGLARAGLWRGELPGGTGKH